MSVQLPDTIKYQALRLVELTGCDYRNALDNLRKGASFDELFEFHKDDEKPLIDNIQNI